MADKSKKKDGGQRYDWNPIMTDYVTNADSSLRKISEKYGIRFTTVKSKAKADSWFATKQEYQKKIQKKAAAKVVAKKANALAGLVTASDCIEQAIIKALQNDPAYLYKHIVTQNLNEEEATLTVLNTKAMRDMMRVIKDVEDVKRSVLDIRKADTEERLRLDRERFEFEQEMARERLNLDKERIALEREKNALRSQMSGVDGDSNYGVVIMPEVLTDNE